MMPAVNHQKDTQILLFTFFEKDPSRIFSTFVSSINSVQMIMERKFNPQETTHEHTYANDVNQNKNKYVYEVVFVVLFCAKSPPKNENKFVPTKRDVQQKKKENKHLYHLFTVLLVVLLK